ncbi:hypothetical protein BASA81_006219 [Batrachochytrium salamandrivorans]|nr:hypothetical protein BASA81_006219 [Batrachochytrium salamandrivorans]
MKSPVEPVPAVNSRPSARRDRSSSPFVHRRKDFPQTRTAAVDDDDLEEEEEEEEEEEDEEEEDEEEKEENIEEEESFTLAPLEISLSFGRALTNFVRISAAYWVEPQRTSNALERILQQDKPTLLGPSRRVIFFLIMGFLLSLVALWITEDEYYTGPRVDHRLVEESDFFPVHISFDNLSCFVNGGPGWVISNISGDARPGRLMGILGSSGSGKTTLAHALLGRNRRSCAVSSGSVQLNGIPGSLDSFLDRVGFVPQDDVLYPELTVLETITFAAKSRLPRYFSNELIQKQVQDTLTTLDLVSVQHTLVGGGAIKTLSGGERKRVSIGMELVTLPSVLVLDEPTSGLDGFQSHKLIGTLKMIAGNYNVSVVAVVHQPSERSFQLFDDLLLLQRGRMVYFGERSDAITYFSSLQSLQEYFAQANNTNTLNDAEILLDVTTGFTSLGEGDFLVSGFFQNQRKLLDERRMVHHNARTRHNVPHVERCGTYRSEFLRSVCQIMSGLQSSFAGPYSAANHGDDGDESTLHYSKRAKPGIGFQSYQWWALLCTLSFRRGLLLEICSVVSLAFTCSFLRHFNRTWQRKHISNFYISVSVGMIAMMGAALEDDILPVRRAVSSGMLLGAHEFALVMYSLMKGFATTHLFSITYFAYRYAYDPPPSSANRDRVFVCQPFSISTYIRFQHLLQLNYFCARGYGLLINVITDHNEKKSMVACCAVLIACHAFSLFSPQSSQLEKDGVYLFGVNHSRAVIVVSSLSYVRYFLEAILLWDPERGDTVGRDFVLRFYSYRDGTEAACANTIVLFTICSQVVRFLLFAFRNANDFQSYHDGPAFIIFLMRVLGVYVLSLMGALAYHHWEEIRATWTTAANEAVKTTIGNRRTSLAVLDARVS